MLYLAGSGNEVAQAFGGRLFADFNDLIVIGTALTLGAAAWLLFAQVLPTWTLLARSLPRESLHHGVINLYWQALITLSGIFFRGFQTRSLHKAARLRIEIELLNPIPERPRRLKYQDEEEYAEAREQWKKDKKDWQNDKKKLLHALVYEEEADRSIDVDTCSPLIDNDGIDRYFNALVSQRQFANEPNFLAKVTIRSGFVAPLHLLGGVLARYEEDWQPIVEEYGRSVIRSGDTLRYSQARRVQAFIFDCWLLWGPSIPICTCPEWHGDVALQYGFGDENNSLVLRVNSPEILRTLGGPNNAHAGVEKPMQLDGFALQTRVSGKLKWGPTLGDTGFCPAQRAIWHDKRLVLDITGEVHGIRRSGGTEEQVFALYYSAYLWIIFVMCEVKDGKPGEPLNPRHQWRDLIPFFIHGNIADAESFDFNASQLARIALNGALELLRADEDLALRFGCGIDETACGYEELYFISAKTIRQRMLDFLAKDRAEDKSVLARLDLEFEQTRPFKDGDYSACALPGIVTDYYNEGKDMPTLHELRFTRKSDMDLLQRFYHECFIPEFPNSDERETLEQIKEYLHRKETGWYGKNNYHVVVMLDGDIPIGGSISDYLVEPNAGVIEYLIVSPDHRGTGLGGQLIEHAERLLHEDSQRSRGRRLDWILSEMDDPYVTPGPTNRFDPFVRPRIWHKWGYKLLNFPYVQPALSASTKPVSNLLLSAKPCSGRFIDSVPAADLRTLIREYLRWAMRIDLPDGNKEFDEMSQFLERRGSIRLVSLSDYLGWEKAPQLLYINEVVNEKDSKLGDAITVYDQVFQDRDTAIGSAEFRKAFEPDGLYYRPNYRYHLWTLSRDADGKCEGMASFLTMPSAGFGGYVGFFEPLRGSGKLSHLGARMEERMVRDGSQARGWYIECDDEEERDIFLKLGFRELDVNYLQPALPGRNIEAPDRFLHLLYKPFGRVYADVEQPQIKTSEFLQAVREIYESIYDIPNPNECTAFNTLEESVKGDEFVPFKPTLSIA
jgi:GNAT superfamily N-acetyltransferase